MDVKTKLKRIVTEWAEFELPDIYERVFDYSLLESTQILSIIGARRTGKTYLCYQMVQRLLETVPRENILYVNLEDERLFPLVGNELTELLDVFFEVCSVNQQKKVYIFIDEIQNVEIWSKWARRLTEQNKNIKLIITGSSSKLLSREIATELRGRTVSFTVYPLSFMEYLSAKGIKQTRIETKRILYSNKRIALKKEFNNYFKTGGFPAAFDSSVRESLLKEYYKVMFYRDLIDRFKIKNIRLLEDFLTLVMDQFSCLYSISATAKKLESFGYSLSKNTLSNFAKYAQEMFLLFEVKKYDTKLKEQLRLPKKVYAIDHGLLQAVRFFNTQDYGRLLENIVFIELMRRGNDIFYYSRKKECDFITVNNGRVIAAIQVSKTVELEKTREREIEGLLEAMNSLNLTEGYIITENENEVIKKDNKTINIQPAWYWLINREYSV